MSVKDFVGASKDWLDEEGIRGLRYVLDQAWMGVLRGLSPFFEEGTNVYEKEWDVLLVLDACRVDAMEEVATEYAFLDNPDTHRSTASTSGEWMRTTFTDEYIHEIENTIYITANGHSEEVRDRPFTEFEDVYNYGWDDDLGTVPAETVTDVAIEAGREQSYDKMIVHYMQPHFPSVPRPIGHGTYFDNVWKGLMIGKGDRREIWKSYIANLRYVLDHVGILLENIDADTVVISSDHGNAKGEWFVYDHPLGVPIDCVKSVPWYTTSTSDHETRDPSVDRNKRDVETNVNERLQQLGYATGNG